MKQTPEEFIEKKLEQVDEKFGDVYIHITGKHYMSDTTLTNRYEKSCFYELKAFLKDALTQLKALYEEKKKTRKIYRHLRIKDEVMQYHDAYRELRENEIKNLPDKYWKNDLPVNSLPTEEQ